MTIGNEPSSNFFKGKFDHSFNGVGKGEKAGISFCLANSSCDGWAFVKQRIVVLSGFEAQ